MSTSNPFKRFIFFGVVFVLCTTLAARAIDFAAIGKGNAPPYGSGSAARPVNPIQRGCSVANTCRGSSSGKSVKSHAENVKEAVLGASEPPAVLGHASNISMPNFQEKHP